MFRIDPAVLQEQETMKTAEMAPPTSAPVLGHTPTLAEQPREMSPAEKAARDLAFNNPNGVPADPEDTRSPMDQFLDWQGNVLTRLGLNKFTDDIRADNPTLVAALARIQSAGAPVPVVCREVIAWPGGDRLAAGGFTVDVYVYTHPDIPTRVVRGTEFLICANPQIIINELVSVGIIRA
jgi:hypothetical protein